MGNWNIKIVLIMTSVLFLGGSAAAQIKPIPVEKADSLMQIEPKPILFLIGTSWCKYCQMQKNQVVKNKIFASQINAFYYVELDAERKDRLKFNETMYSYKVSSSSSGIHELALALNGSNDIKFPTWVLLDQNDEVIFRRQGVIGKTDLDKLVNAIMLIK